jgi:hypothetical protein
MFLLKKFHKCSFKGLENDIILSQKDFLMTFCKLQMKYS